jgi:putative transposase
MFIVEKFLISLIKDYRKHTVSTDGGTWYLKVKHHLHSTATPPMRKSIIERTIQYLKNRTEYFDGYFPCRREVQTNPFEKLAQSIC